MKKKLVVIALAFVMLGNLIACSVQKADGQKSSEITEEVTTSIPEEMIQSSDEIVISDTTEENVDAVQEKEVEEIDIKETKEIVPIKYMNKEGIVNEELGIIIRNGSAEWSKLGLQANICYDTGMAYENKYVTCYYYEGDIESYISENEGMEKGVLDNVEYAAPGESYEGFAKVAFVDNGIVLEIDMIEEDLEKIWQNGLYTYEGEETEYLVYMVEDALYCPALGLEFSGVYGHWDENVFEDGSVIIQASTGDGGISIYSNGERDAFLDDADPIKVIEDFYSSWGDVLEEPVEQIFGKYMYIGKGYTTDIMKNWMFASSETLNLIRIDCRVNNEIESYISMIEEIK